MASDSCCRICLIIGLVSTVIGMVAFTTGILVQEYVKTSPTMPSDGEKYSVVVDAGSSGSRAILYSFQAVEGRNMKQLDIRNIKHPISSHSQNASTASEHIFDCVQEVIKKVAGEGDVTLYLGATAGMRLLQYRDSDASAAVMANLRQKLKGGVLVVNNAGRQIRIISGEEEATDAWITVNQLHGSLGSQQPTVGALDLGGASTQISFVPSSVPSGTPTSDIQLYGQQYRVYGQSYLCFGKGRVKERILAVLASESNVTDNIDHPCLPEGSSVNISYNDLFEKPCVRGPVAKSTHGSDVPRSHNMTDSILTFNGKSDVRGCRRLIKNLFANATVCVPGRCNHKVPNLHGQFFAFSGFYFVTKFLNLTKPAADYSQFVTAVDNYCTEKWNKISGYPGKDIHKKGYCLDGVYTQQILHMYGFNSTNWNTINFVSKVNNTKVGWTLGFLLKEVQEFYKRYTWINSRWILYILIGCLAACGLTFVILLVTLVIDKKKTVVRSLNLNHA